MLANVPWRLYSSPRGERGFRRVTDVLLLAAAAFGLALLIAAYPPGRFERSLASLLANVPSVLRPLWSALHALLVVWAAGLVVSAAAARRTRVLLQAVVAIGVAIGLAVVSARLALGEWPSVAGATWNGVGTPGFPGVRLAEAAAVTLTISLQLVRPLQRANRWILALGFGGALLLGDAAPTGVAAAFLIAVAASSAVRLAFGTSAGRPQLPEVANQLDGLGIAADGLAVEQWPVAGVFVARARDPEGRALLIKVHGRDAYDNQLVENVWRTLWYRDTDLGLALSWSQVAEHEALVTLLAREGGVRTQEVVRVATTERSEALLVLRGEARPLETLGEDELTDDLVHAAWRTLDALHSAGVAHRRIDTRTVALVDGSAGFVDFAGGTADPTPDQQMTDRAQLLVTTATRFGADQALAAAIDSLGADGLGALLPYLQQAALAGPLRTAVRAAGLDLDELRKQAAATVGVEEPPLVRLRRVTWRGFAQTALLALAAFAILIFATGIDYDQLGSALEHASWSWIVLGAVLAQAPRITQALSTLGSVVAQLRFGPIYALQLATSYMNLALPSSVARLAVNIRFFQLQGIAPAAAVTAGAIDSFAGTVIQVVLLGGLLLLTESTLNLELSTPSRGALTVIGILAAVVVAIVVTVLVVGRIRRAIASRVRTWWPQVRVALGALRASNKLALLLLGNLATEILFAAALGLFALGLSYHISIWDLLVINISISLVGTLIPIPGNIGIAEFGLTVGLTAAGMTEEAALATALLYRVATFYLPPVWGFFALRWLERNRYL
jgi:glycosyltransferase 2 family protein